MTPRSSSNSKEKEPVEQQKMALQRKKCSGTLVREELHCETWSSTGLGKGEGLGSSGTRDLWRVSGKIRKGRQE